MTIPLTLPPNQTLDRRNIIRGAAVLAATAVSMRAASAATVTPLGQTGSHQVDQSAAPRATAREPISGCSPGVRRAHCFVRARQFPGLRRHHGGRTCRNRVPLG